MRIWSWCTTACNQSRMLFLLQDVSVQVIMLLNQRVNYFGVVQPYFCYKGGDRAFLVMDAGLQLVDLCTQSTENCKASGRMEGGMQGFRMHVESWRKLRNTTDWTARIQDSLALCLKVLSPFSES